MARLTQRFLQQTKGTISVPFFVSVSASCRPIPAASLLGSAIIAKRR
jgi:hypothetical protein